MVSTLDAIGVLPLARRARWTVAPVFGELPWGLDGWGYLPLWRPGMPCLVLTSPKCASTVVTRWYFWQLDLLKEAEARDPWIHVYEGEFKSKRGYLRDLTRAVRDDMPALRFCRDPAARLYSAYLSISWDRLVMHPRHWANPTRMAVVEALSGRDAPLDKPFSFVQFVDWLATRNVHTLDSHLQPQTTKLDDRLNVHHAPIETLRASLDHAAEAFALKPLTDAVWARISPSSHHHPKSDSASGGLLAELARPRPLGDVRDAPSISSEQLTGTPLGGRIRHLYADDYRRLNYGKEHGHSPPPPQDRPCVDP